MSERASATTLAAAIVAVTAAAMVVGVDVQRLMVAKAMAQSAADAAALAAAPLTFAPFGSNRTPSVEAAVFAAANGATLVSCECPSDPVWRARTVVVRVAVEVESLLPISRVSAVAAAEFDPTVWLAP